MKESDGGAHFVSLPFNRLLGTCSPVLGAHGCRECEG
jgi:hypothetical protein